MVIPSDVGEPFDSPVRHTLARARSARRSPINQASLFTLIAIETTLRKMRATAGREWKRSANCDRR